MRMTLIKDNEAVYLINDADAICISGKIGAGVGFAIL